MEGKAIIGELIITASTGATLTASSDIGLAWKWAETEVNASAARGECKSWKDTPYGEQCAHVAEALAELRRAYREANES